MSSKGKRTHPTYGSWFRNPALKRDVFETEKNPTNLNFLPTTIRRCFPRMLQKITAAGCLVSWYGLVHRVRESLQAARKEQRYNADAQNQPVVMKQVLVFELVSLFELERNPHKLGTFFPRGMHHLRDYLPSQHRKQDSFFHFPSNHIFI